LAFFSTWCPKGTSIQKLVSVEGHRWAIEDSFELWPVADVAVYQNRVRKKHSKTVGVSGGGRKAGPPSETLQVSL
jgi:hypothetical protein